MRSLWDAAALLQSGLLRRVLPDWTLPAADVYVIFPVREHLSAKVRAFVDFLLAEFAGYRSARDEPGQWSVNRLDRE